MKKLLHHDVSLKKVLRRAVLEKNTEMEYIDWLNLVFKINPSDRATITVISLRPKDKTKYSKGTFFRFAKLDLEKQLKESILLTDFVNINFLSGLKYSEILERLMPIFNGEHFVKTALILDVSGVQCPADTDKEINVSLVRKLPNEKFEEIDYDTRPVSIRDLTAGNIYLRVHAGNNHPLYYGEQFILLK